MHAIVTFVCRGSADLKTFLFYKQLPIFIFFFFGLTQKRNKKSQGKARSLRASLPSCASPGATAYVLLFGLLRDTLVSVTFRFSAGALAQFIRAYRCEI